MSRGKLYRTSGQVWHITHRCHNKEYHLKFKRDKKRWLYWLFQTKKRYGLCILNYNVTSNHIHLLVYDDSRIDVIPKSMLLIASRTAREYNMRKNRSGAFWEDHYHATAVETSFHLNQCMVYIDLNMVRAGAVKHPIMWPFCGYHEIMSNRLRYRLIDICKLMELIKIKELYRLRQLYKVMVDNYLNAGNFDRESHWTESVAVGSEEFIKEIKSKLGIKVGHRKTVESGGLFALQEEVSPYSSDFLWKKGSLREKKGP